MSLAANHTARPARTPRGARPALEAAALAESAGATVPEDLPPSMAQRLAAQLGRTVSYLEAAEEVLWITELDLADVPSARWERGMLWRQRQVLLLRRMRTEDASYAAWLAVR